MTTLAGIWGLVAGKTVGGTTTASGAGRPEDCRLRAIPREEIHFTVKALDNTRVVRLVDTKDRATSFGVASTVPIAAVLFIALLLPGGYNLLASRRMDRLQHEREALLNQARSLKAEHTALVSPKALDEWAGTEYEAPKAHAVIFAPPGQDARASLEPQGPGRAAPPARR